MVAVGGASLSVCTKPAVVGLYTAQARPLSPRAAWTRGEGWECTWKVDATKWGSLKRSPILADLENSNFNLKTHFYSESLFCVLF